ncbi:hypothetical protein TcasGA2_TC008377 [Tribolium castaneum]|uniref:Uncharacterized protein n=1 Tax=Tribolium castaneum TaxID=7070 RepID=D2A1D8_TRICA|nr:hypothetical protein TcasGA2_TC008377 [Tribolium castaneum]
MPHDNVLKTQTAHPDAEKPVAIPLFVKLPKGRLNRRKRVLDEKRPSAKMKKLEYSIRHKNRKLVISIAISSSVLFSRRRN